MSGDGIPTVRLAEPQADRLIEAISRAIKGTRAPSAGGIACALGSASVGIVIGLIALCKLESEFPDVI